MQKFYLSERNKDFYTVYEHIRKESVKKGGYLSVEEIAKKAVMRPSQSYYISKQAIYKVILRRRCMRDDGHRQKSLCDAIFKEYFEIKKQHPDYCPNKIAGMIELLPAPRFYMSDRTASILAYQLIKTNGNAIFNSNAFYNRIFSI